MDSEPAVAAGAAAATTEHAVADIKLSFTIIQTAWRLRQKKRRIRAAAVIQSHFRLYRAAQRFPAAATLLGDALNGRDAFHPLDKESIHYYGRYHNETWKKIGGSQGGAFPLPPLWGVPAERSYAPHFPPNVISHVFNPLSCLPRPSFVEFYTDDGSGLC
jgi:hypothetical protein